MHLEYLCGKFRMKTQRWILPMFDIKHFEFYYKLRTLPFVNEIWLFGSRSKGSEKSHSDIDLAIVCPAASEEAWQQVRDIIDHADTLLKIDCIRFDKLSDMRLRHEIESAKQVLFKRTENSYEWYETFLDLSEAIEKFRRVLKIDREKFPFAVEATIQVFEYTFELYWKLLKKIIYAEGIEVNSPRTTLQQAFILKLIDNDQIWLEIMESRNLTSHIYRQTTANEIYNHCKLYLPVMEQTFQKIKERYEL